MEVLERVEAPAVAPVPSILDPRVERGARILDRELPGWENMIDLETFKLSSSCHCIFGQLGGGSYHLGAERVGYPDGTTHGTYCPNYAEYPALDQDWRLAILARRTTSA